MLAKESIEYLDHMGDDLSVANAARVSMDKHHEILEKGDLGLIRYLANHNHFTPFTHATIKMRETVPIFVARQRFKHTVGFSYNEISRRYVSDDPQFYYIDEWRMKPSDNIKQGSGQTFSPDMNKHFSQGYRKHCDASLKLYQEYLANDVAPELARSVLPQSMLTSYIVTGSLYAWLNMIKLRVDDHAQKEIQDLAIKARHIVRKLFPISSEAIL